MSKSITLIQIPGTTFVFAIELPQTASDDSLTTEQEIIIELDAEIARLRAKVKELEGKE